ncbi:MAG: response regulator transcription factor [Planctomycetes bacterium]|nr:response regulator transcription factor [Planctomycetota bacterium]
MRILVVEDEKKLAGFIKRALVEDAHAVDVCHDGEEGAHLASTESYDLLILDLLLPKKDGWTVLREFREKKRATPVLILSARGQVKDRVKGLDLGADDYLAKPFALDELRARVRALLRRGSEASASTLKVADVTMDLLRREVHRGKDEIRLTPREYALLEYLMRHPNRVLTRTSIAEHVWDYSFDWQSNVVDVFVNYLRRKLDGDRHPKLIHTVRGVGYMIKEPDAEVP